ncbi:alpha-1,3/1,6-mannosyltransferase ALG2 [Basidiobolus meristosporus CBS 931.73]|uniref:Alpha-1,3/1,6-mannosyltransferase ALG2 n=1 Tax=Basidiobolus meristosporus CBS 931.73 TaxID=1314790 RepID=A0A1Y1YXI3_9FUNG|nr:alpha-1,3/1,6-mannosyltransferase ALG2 [Basidiobolus meristosporus CBS 931.73]|eukprot:ORY02594.1 alpha-1,3/1,6-mannosyltransferase ALG2 [Basidiobolus meristosporus CBS 931.73]
MVSEVSSNTKLRVAFVHPDLGIGGAERLVVDSAVGLQKRGHKVVMYTSHHDPKHCFEETSDGTLEVRVRGNTFVPRSIFGYFYIVCAICRNLLLTLSLLRDQEKYDIIFCDQLSISIPLLRFSGAKILFYCHFPDKLLTQRNSLLKKLYRYPIDYLEELTTGMADKILVNSLFTASIFTESFKTIKDIPGVLYPSIHFDYYGQQPDLANPSLKPLISNKKTIISINRFERKKNIELGIHSFARLQSLMSNEEFSQLRLVVAGGYDLRVSENVEYLEELKTLAQKHGLSTFVIDQQSLSAPPEDTNVLFLPSFDEAQRSYLFSTALCLLYTPSNEHFGIVPVEAMYSKVPVVAVNSGGPRESVKDGVTGFLCESSTEAFTEAIYKIYKGEVDGNAMGEAGKKHVQEMFSLPSFIDRLEKILFNLRKKSVSFIYLYLSTIFLTGILMYALVSFF